MAAACALDGENAMNFGGGYHHAFRDRGEGFCLFADVALALAIHRASGRLGPDEHVAVIDLDAHRGNGFESIVAGDRLGGLALSPSGVEARDRAVLGLLASRGISTVVTISGGYSEGSYQLVANLAGHMARL